MASFEWIETKNHQRLRGLSLTLWKTENKGLISLIVNNVISNWRKVKVLVNYPKLNLHLPINLISKHIK